MTHPPLSYAQESLWYFSRLEPDNAAVNEVLLLRLRGALDVPALERALNELLRRHDILRTVYPVENGAPVQVVQPFQPQSLSQKDFSNEPSTGRAAQDALHEEGYRPFDLERGPVTRTGLARIAAQEHLLLFATHHIAFDAWSRQIWLDELAQLYSAFVRGEVPALPDAPQYAEYALRQRTWLQGETLRRSLEYWKNSLRGELPVLDLPHKPASGVTRSGRAERTLFWLPADFLAEAKSFCRRERASLFHVLLAAFGELLHRYSGQTDVIVGSPFANRGPRELGKHLESTLGVFINTMPLRLDLSGDPAIRALLKRVRNLALDSMSFQFLPFERLVMELEPQRVEGRHPIFQVMINMRNVPQRAHVFDGLESEIIFEKSLGALFDLSLEFQEQDEKLQCAFRYDVDRFERGLIERMTAHYQNLLRAFIMHPDAPLSTLEMLSAQEKQQIVTEWNRTEAAYPEVCLHQLAEQQARATPQATAVICGNEQITYAELLEKSNRLAALLVERGIHEGDLVGMYLPRSIDLVAAQLAILKTGAAYLPLDLSHPPERVNFILRDARPAAILTIGRLAAALPADIPRLVLDSISLPESSAPISRGRPDSLAYVIYTSGSTGNPKGVQTFHRGAVSYITYMITAHGLRPGERVLQLTSFTFDPHVRDTLGTLAFGGVLLLMSDDEARDPSALVRAIQILKPAVILSLVPTLLRALTFAAAGQTNLSSLRLVMTSGEALHGVDVTAFRSAFGAGVKVVNQYGPTECTQISTAYTVPGDVFEKGNLPIGRPVANVRLYVLDEFLRPVPAGVKGEICIGGVGVGGGYLSRPELTAEKFVPDPFGKPGERLYRTGDVGSFGPDGLLMFWGRRDAQVKLRGYRVELGEIESVLKDQPQVREAAVALLDEGKESARLAAFVVPKAEGGLVGVDLRVVCSTRLPEVMVPSVFVTVTALPRTSTGKVDRNALTKHPLDGGLSPQRQVPANDLERRLLDIWKDALDVEDLGVTDNFFEMGGHSLMAVWMAARIAEETGREISLQLLITRPTVRALAGWLEHPDAAVSSEPLVELRPGAGAPVFIIPAGDRTALSKLKMARQIKPGYRVFGLEYPEPTPENIGPQRLDVLADYFSALIRSVHPNGPYYVFGSCLGGVLAFLVGQRLNVDGMGLSVAIDAAAPSLPSSSRRTAAYYGRRFSYLARERKLGLLLSLRLMNFTTRMRRFWGEEKFRRKVLAKFQTAYSIPEPYPGRALIILNGLAAESARLKNWQAAVPHGEVVILSNTAHFDMAQEHASRAILDLINQFLPDA